MFKICVEKAIEAAEAAYRPHLRAGASDPYHAMFPEFCGLCALKAAPAILELGSREVTDISRRRQFFSFAGEYIGLDIHSGPGVDVVGDVHQLSSIFPDQKFDAIYSVSVFEHLAFPWKAALEINRVLKIGGLCFVSTHPVWPPHELPWDFWRFPLAGLRVLFNNAVGFRILRATEGLPARIHSLVDDPPTRGLPHFEASLGVALIAVKTSDYDRERFRWDVPVEAVSDGIYPKHDHVLSHKIS
jgi:SAM-dependent methyltransferase